MGCCLNFKFWLHPELHKLLLLLLLFFFYVSLKSILPRDLPADDTDYTRRKVLCEDNKQITNSCIFVYARLLCFLYPFTTCFFLYFFSPFS